MKKKVRDSNMELLRITAMLLVLIYHANFLSFGEPNSIEARETPLNVILRDFFNACSVVCVNLFVFISGWYGIKFKIKKFCEFLFQVSFIVAVTLVFFCNITNHKFDRHDFQSIFLLTDELWFVKAYIILYIFSPALNYFIDRCSQKQLLSTIIIFFLFQSLYGWAFVVVKWINDGYSPICFFGIYLLAAYIKKYKHFLTSFSAKNDLTIYFVIASLNSLIAYFTILYGFNAYMWLNSYASPIVILETIYLSLFFSKLSIKSSVVNWFASSSFAVYLAHCSRNILGEYCNFIRTLSDIYPMLQFVFVLTLFLLIVFMVCIFIDKIRILLWRRIEYITNL